MRKYNKEIVKRTAHRDEHVASQSRKVRGQKQKKFSTKTIRKANGRRPRVMKGGYKLSRKGN